jgi:hypothetical protein
VSLNTRVKRKIWYQVTKGEAARNFRDQQTCNVSGAEILQARNTKNREKRKVSAQGKKIDISPYMPEKERGSECKYASPYFAWKPCYY